MKKKLILNEKYIKNTITTLFVLLIVSCGGGGGSSGGVSRANNNSSNPPSQPDTSPPPTGTFDEIKSQYEGNYEYSSQWGLAAINASSAYARGATGKGIVIGITDSGLDTTHDEIASSRVSLESNLSYSNYTPNTRQKRHGTMVASVAAGTLAEDDDSPMHGVAFDSTVLFTAIQLAEPDEDYDPVDLGDSDGNNAPDFTGIDNFFSQLFRIYNVEDVDIVNNSYGYSGNINDYSELQIRNAFPKTIEEMAQASTPDSEKTIYVWAAGNAGSYADQGVDYSSPELLPGMSLYISEIQTHSIAVVAIDEDGEISDFSNRCGIAADFCIAAPGGDITVAYPVTNADQGIYADDDYDCEDINNCFAVANGTSFASPFVAGGLAVIAEYFSGQLGSTEIVQRMFSTANKTGIYADTSIYGQGLLDLDAATSPVGELSAVVANSLNSVRIPLLENNLNITNIAVGDALASSASNISFILFDELDAPFRIPLSTFISNEIININRSFSIGLNLDTVRHTSKNSGGKISIEFKKNKFDNLGVYNYAYEQSVIDQSYGFSFMSDDHSLNISSGLEFDSNFGLNSYAQLNSIEKSLLQNPWASFTQKGMSFGKTFQLDNGRLGVLTSMGKNKSQDPFDNESSNNHAFLVEYLNQSKNLSFQFGKVNERGSFSGLSSSGMFNTNKISTTNFVGMKFVNETPFGRVLGSLYNGVSPGKKMSGMVEEFSRRKLKSFSLGFQPSINLKNSSLLISISQPLVMNYGEMKLSLPAFRTPNKEILMNSHTLDISPRYKEMHSKITFEHFSKLGNLSVALGYRENPFHSNRYRDYWYTKISLYRSY